MKSIIKIVALPIVIVCMVLGLSQTALASGSFHATNGVHVRESAATSSKSLTTVSAGSVVDVVEHDPAGWSKVQVGSVVGYIRSDFLKFNVGDTPETFRVTAPGGVNVRETASTSAASLKAVGRGTDVSVLEHDPAGWSKVQVGNVTGYIRSDFLKHPGTATLTSGGNAAASGGFVEDLYTVGSVNMRASASTSANVVKVLANGTRVGVIEHETNGWSKVSHNGTDGYIRSDLLAPLSATAQETSVRYTIGNVNMRTSASEKADKIRTLPKATAVEVLANESNGWSKVIHNGTEGYIRSDLLTSSAQGEPQSYYTVGDVNMRASASTSSSIIKTLPKGAVVAVLENVTNGNETWSRVTHNDNAGYIRADLLSSSQTGTGQTIAIMKTITGVNVRSGPSTSTKVLTTLVGGSSVDVLANESNGWSRVRVGNTLGYIRSDLLHAGANVEQVTMSEISHLLPYRKDIRVVDVRTGISYNIRIFSKGVHADYEPATRDDTDALFRSRNGIRSWAVRPVWVYVDNRVFAAATHGMPHDVSWIKDNGCDGHLCLHFHNTTNSNKTFQNDLRKAAQEAYDKRPR